MIIGTRARCVLHLNENFQRQMRNLTYSTVSQAPSRSCFTARYSRISLSKSKASSCSPVCCFQAFQRIHFGSGFCRKRGNYIKVESSVGHTGPQETCFDVSFGCQRTTMRLLAPKWKMLPHFKCNVRRSLWPEGCFSAGLLLGSLICYSSSVPVHAEAPQEKKGNEEHHDPSSVHLSRGKIVHKNYSVIGIPGDGRCLFRSIAHGACLRSGVPAPSESIQRELADELRARVADEFVRRRKETEWFIEGDFDIYVSEMRKPHVWGGEPELLMLSHVLKMPITVYMHDEDSGGLISIAEYGQEYGKEDPIRVLYHGFGHYDALLIPGNKGARSRF
ncbi:hypothetical protein Ancab_030972 [Ancistrocladus abbreviatus]